MFDKSVKKWSARVRVGCKGLVDDSRSGQANTVITVDLIDKMDDLVRSDSHMTTRMLEENGGCQSWNSVHSSLLEIALSDAHWTPKRLTDQQKEFSTVIALQHSFIIRKTPLFWRVSRQGVDHRLFRSLGSTIVEFLEHRGTITTDLYCKTIESVLRFIKNKK